MNRFLAGVFVIFLFFRSLPLFGSEPEVPIPWNWSVTSDFGPRKLNGTWDWHEGIDFSISPGNGDLGTPISTVEDGILMAIANRGEFYNVDVEGNHGRWLFGHIFKNDQHRINDWELRLNAILVNPNDPEDSRIRNVIIQWADYQTTSIAIKILSSELSGFFVKTDTNSGYIYGVNGQPIITINTVTTGEEIAIMGNANDPDHPVPVHLHLGLNYPNDNPYYHLIHAQDNQMSATILNPLNGQVFDSSSTPTVPFEVRILTSNKWDLDKVNMWIEVNGDPSNKIFFPSDMAYTFQFGGDPLSGKSNTHIASDGTTTGTIPDINNTGESLGDDTFVYLKDISTLPAGNHRFVIGCLDVNDHEGCEGTSVMFEIQGEQCNGPDTTPPEIALDYAAYACRNEEGPFNLCGTVSDNCSDPILSLNDQPVQLDPTNGPHSFTFCQTVDLQEGVNPFEFVAVDASTNSVVLPHEITVDATPPQVVNLVPADGSLNVADNSPVQAVFNEELGAGQILVAGEGASGGSALNNNVIFFSHAPFAADMTYQATTVDVSDTCGNLAGDLSWFFSTAPFESWIDEPALDDDEWYSEGNLDIHGFIKNPAEEATVEGCAIVVTV